MTLATNIQLVKTSGQEIIETFPIAGQDNNTQGFRDNFSKTQSGLVAAGNSLEEIDNRTPKLDESNDFNNVGTVINGLFLNNKGKTKDVLIGTSQDQNTPVTKDINVSEAEYFRIKVYAPCTQLRLIGWPQLSNQDFGSNVYRKVRLEFFQPNALTKTVKFAGDGTYDTIKYSDVGTLYNSGDGLEVSGDSIIVDAWVSDYSNQANTGLTIYLQLVGTFTEA